MGLASPMTAQEFRTRCMTQPNAVVDFTSIMVKFAAVDGEYPGFLFRCGVPRVETQKEAEPVKPKPSQPIKRTA